MKNLKLLVLVCVVLFSNAASAQWFTTGNTLTSTGILGGNSGNFDILFRRNGVQAGLLNSASSNTSFGVSSLISVTTGTLNTAVGTSALTANTTGYNNIAVGTSALTTNTSGFQNVGVGTGALNVNNGQANVAIGSYSLVANTSGPNNVAVGYQSMGFSTSGQQNAGLGYQSLIGNTTGSNNIGVGYRALATNTTGSNNTALGYNANVGSAALTNATAIGSGAVANLSNSIVLGSGANVAIGTSSPNASALLDLTSTTQGLLLPRLTTTQKNTIATPATGLQVYDNTVNQPSYYNGSAWVNLGASSGWSLTGNSGTIPGTNFIGTTDNQNLIFKVNNIQQGLLSTIGDIALGISALNPLSTGGYNVALGPYTLFANVGGYLNTAIGDASLYNNTSGYLNTAIGDGALIGNISGNNNVGIGQNAYSGNSTGSENVSVGDHSGNSGGSGTDNTFIGAYSQMPSGSGPVSAATAVGMSATVGNASTALGASASAGWNNSTAVGGGAYATADNTMQFGNTNVIGWGFAGATPTSANVLVVGTNSTNGNGAYLTAGGMWTNGSDRNLKEDFTTPDGKDVLSRIKKLSVTKWKYKGTSEYHIGPMAQDFYEQFNLGTDNKHIGTTDPAGIALVAIKELVEQNDSLKNANTQQQAINAQQEELNNNLQMQLNNLKTTISQMQTAMSQCCNSYSSNMATAAKPQLVTGIDAATLQQNSPNPYNGNTIIAYHLPQSTTNAEIIVSDLTGNIIKSVSLNGVGDGQITFAAGSLASGSYFYTLLVNGQKIDTKEMIIAH